MRGAIVSGGALLVAQGMTSIAGCASFSSADDARSSIEGDAAATSEASVVDAAPRQPTILVSAITLPTALAANDDMIVWGSDTGTVFTSQIDGANVATLSNYGGSPRRLLIRPNDLLWCDHTGARPGMWRRANDGTVTTAPSNLPITSFAPFGTDFATFFSSTNTITVIDEAGQAKVSYSGFGNLYDIVADGDDVVWTDSGEGKIMRLQRGGTPQTIAEGESDVRAVARNADGIYWSLATTTIRRFDRANAARADVATGESGVHGIVADETGVYWLTNDSLRRWTKASRKVETLATGQPNTNTENENVPRFRKVALTSKYVVWLTATDLRRIEK
jgi:hypothetical protein